MKKIQILGNQNKICFESNYTLKCAHECEEFSIIIVFDGEETYSFRNKEIKVTPANFFIINNGTKYLREIDSELPVNTLSLSYTNDFLSEFYHALISSDSILLDEPNRAPKIDPRFMETLYPLKGDMLFNLLHLKNTPSNDFGDDLLMNEYLYHSLFNFYRVYKKEIIIKSEQLKVQNINARNELFRRLNNAKDYMISNYNKNIRLEDICRYACLSETHFYRSFKKVYNCSPHQYMIDLRLNQAKYMLKYTRNDLKEIVGLIGFDCVSSFIRLFKERFGITPGNFRLRIAA